MGQAAQAQDVTFDRAFTRFGLCRQRAGGENLASHAQVYRNVRAERRFRKHAGPHLSGSSGKREVVVRRRILPANFLLARNQEQSPFLACDHISPGDTMSREQKVAAVEAYLNCFATKDLSKVPLAEDATFEGPLVGKLAGRQTIK